MALTVKIKGDASHFEKTMAKVKASGERVGKVFSTIGKGAAYTATGLLAAGAGAVYLGTSLARMAEDGAEAENRLENVVKQMGLFKGEVESVTSRLGDLADETARATGVDDDQILATQAKLATFKELAKTADVVGGAFDRATMAAIDMAAAGFGSAEQNAVQLGKALNDPVNGINALKRAGITFTQTERDRIKTLVESNQMLAAQETILKAIETQVGGTAAATAKGSARIGVALSQIGEKLGAPMSDVFSKIADEIGKQMPTITGVIAQGFAGDMTVFVKIGRVIGESILSGASAVIGGSFMNGVVRPMVETATSLSAQGGDPKATANSIIGEQLSTAQLFKEDPALNAALEDLRLEIRAINSGGNINAYKQTLEEMKRIRQLAEQGLFDKQPAPRYSR